MNTSRFQPHVLHSRHATASHILLTLPTRQTSLVPPPLSLTAVPHLQLSKDSELQLEQARAAALDQLRSHQRMLDSAMHDFVKVCWLCCVVVLLSPFVVVCGACGAPPAHSVCCAPLCCAAPQDMDETRRVQGDALKEEERQTFLLSAFGERVHKRKGQEASEWR